MSNNFVFTEMEKDILRRDFENFLNRKDSEAFIFYFATCKKGSAIWEMSTTACGKMSKKDVLCAMASGCDRMLEQRETFGGNINATLQ